MSGVNGYVVGNVSFGPAQPLTVEQADQVMNRMADTIVELTHKLDEANARIALLEGKRAPRLTDEDDGFESIADKEAADRIGGNPWSNF